MDISLKLIKMEAGWASTHWCPSELKGFFSKNLTLMGHIYK